MVFTRRTRVFRGTADFRVREGTFNLSVIVPGKPEVSRKVEVPSPEYDLPV
jgi:hypothetical protein